MSMSEEKRRMVAGEWYDPRDAQLGDEQARVRKLVRRFNHNELTADEWRALLEEILGEFGEGANVEAGAFACDYGKNIFLGAGSGLNHGCVLLDCAPIRIGKHTMIGPQVKIIAVTHPDNHEGRRGGRFCKGVPVTIGDDCWIGAGSVILPGVTIGDRVRVGAGSVVTKDVPADTTVIGVPARPLPTQTYVCAA